MDTYFVLAFLNREFIFLLFIFIYMLLLFICVEANTQKYVVLGIKPKGAIQQNFHTSHLKIGWDMLFLSFCDLPQIWNFFKCPPNMLGFQACTLKLYLTIVSLISKFSHCFYKWIIMLLLFLKCTKPIKHSTTHKGKGNEVLINVITKTLQTEHYICKSYELSKEH